MGIPYNKNYPYDNISMLDPRGKFLSFIDKKKAKWYIKKDLAELTDPKTLKLKFEPNIRSRLEPNDITDDHIFYKTPRENICVVCGCTDNLTKHHIVPYRYRRHFPNTLKSRSSYDIITMCVTDHEKYEIFSNALHNKLIKNYHPAITNILREIKATDKINKAIRKVHQNKAPLDKIEAARIILLDKFGDSDPMALKYLDAGPLHSEIYKTIVDNITDYDQFIIMWRKHFVEFANPQFLPKNWIDLINIVRRIRDGEG